MTEELMKNPYVISLLFDKKLIDLGKWPEDICSEIEEWNEITDYEMQKTKAAFLISSLILKILGRDCCSRGRIRAKRLGKALANFEQITISTRGLERKYYRDHLNHIIRVALLARAVSQKSPFHLSDRDLNKLVLASLFHDVAYPLSNVSRSVRFSIKAIKDCYNIASGASLIPKIKFRLNKNKFKSLFPELFREKLRLEELDHGILSSLEFTSYLEENALEKYEEAINAIALHSPSNTRKINYEQEKILSVLVLADELQDWGRPTGHLAQLSFIPKIEKFKLEDNVLQGEYNTKKITGFSTLKQIYGKRRNLVRIRLPKDFHFSLKFSFDDFDEINLLDVENSVQELFNECYRLESSLFNPSHFEKLYRNDSVFEDEYYGRSIPKKTKLELFDSLKVTKLSSRSPFRNLRLFFNDIIKESLITNIDIDEITHFQFQSSPSGFIKLVLVSKSNDVFEGEIKSINDREVLDLAMYLLSEIRFFNISIHKIARFRTSKYPVELGFEGFPRNKDIAEVVQQTKQPKIQQYCKLLIKLRDCIFNDGIFFFKTPTNN